MAYPRMFRVMWAGQSISNLGDTLYLLAIVTMVYQLTGSAMFASLVPLARVVGQLICGVAAPLVMDRFQLTLLIKLSQLLQVVLFAFLIVVCRDMVESDIPTVLVLIAMLSFTDGITTPVRNALIPQYVGRGELLRANGLMSTTDQIVMMSGWAAGGVIVAWLGASTVMLGTLGIYAVALLLTLQLREPATPKAAIAAAEQAEDDIQRDDEISLLPGGEQHIRKEKGSAWESVKEGWQNIWRNPVLRLLIIIDAIEGTVGAAWIGAMLLVYATEQLGSGTEWYGFINGGYFAGCIVGGLLVVTFTRRLSRFPALSILVGAGIMGLLTLAFAWITAPALALLIVILMGPPQQLREVTRRTVFQKACPPEQLPKVMSAENTLVYSLFGLSVVLLSWMADRWGVEIVYTMTGVFYLITALLVGINRKKIQAAAVDGQNVKPVSQ
ncbi:Major Facilitator Superfamily protein [Paenibacillaceae bacterium GAS479]|nr:Major Facilitator Superfamily protein [Paenibacillaceae bacterium GAS479]